MKDQQMLITKMVLDSWYQQVKRTGDLLNTLSDEQLLQEVATNRNRGIYLLGHLTAVHDRMLPLLNFGKQLYPSLDDIFINSPDKVVTDLPAAQDLRLYWENANATLAKHFDNLQPDEWLQKHNAVSAEEFINEPHRNRLNVVLNRTSHLSYHFGQLAFLKN